MSYSTAVVCVWLAGLGNSAQADEPFVQWASTYSDSRYGWFVSAVPGSAPTLAQTIQTNGNTILLRFDMGGRLLASNTFPVVAARIKTDNTGALYCLGGSGQAPTALSAAKYNPDGTLAWTTNATPPSSGLNSYFGAFALGADHSIFALAAVQGSFTLGSFTFDDGNGLLLCRIDKDGQVIWARRILEAAGVTDRYSRAGAWSLDLDPSGNVIFSGWLDPGPIDFLGTTLNPGATTTSGWGEGYIAKCDSNGNLLWVHLGHLDPDGNGTGIAYVQSRVDRLGNTYFLEGEGYLGKVDANGNVLWSKTFAGAGLRWGLAIDVDNEPIFSGNIDGTVNFDSIALRAKTSDAQGFFVAKCDPNGNVRWAIAGGSSAPDAVMDNGTAVACDEAGNILFSTGIVATGAFDGISLPNRPDYYGDTHVLARLTERPQIQISKSAEATTVTFPAKATNYILEAATSLPTLSWNVVTNTPTVSGRDRSVQLSATVDQGFFRLRKR